jgi:competence protein ComEC
MGYKESWATIGRPQRWRQTLPNTRQLLIAALISLLAAGYIQVRIPQPGFQDISRLVSTDQGSLPAQVTGTIESRPALTRRDSVQIWLNVQQARLNQHLDPEQQQATGKLYVIPVNL